MNQELMTLDFWQDTVIYEGKTLPVGALACDALNVPADTIAKMNEQCEKINLLLGTLNAGQDASALFPMAREAALTMLDILSETPPFSYMNISKHRERIERVFTADNALKYVEFAIKAATNSLPFEEVPNYADAIILQLVKRMHYVSFVGMFRSDLFEGLCVGHAPKKCRICGKWFLTTNARHTKYCGGYAPGDKLHRTCRQIGNLKGRTQRELADDHPIKQVYVTRLNTINRYIKRGTLDADLAKAMKKLAKDKMLRAISDVAYAHGDYEKEMEQDALTREATK